MFYGALLAVAVGIGALRGHPNVLVIGAVPADPRALGTRLVASALVGLAVALCVVFTTRLMTHRWQWARVLHQEFHALVQGMEGREILLLALTSAVAEECFFRGALQPMVGVVAQAFLFSTLHFRPRARFLPWTLMSLVVGLGLGLLASWRGELAAPIVAHFTINFVNLGYISRTELRT